MRRHVCFGLIHHARRHRKIDDAWRRKGEKDSTALMKAVKGDISISL